MSIETDFIIKHSLSNSTHLSLAIKIGLAFSELKRTIITEFLKRLETDIQLALGSQWKASAKTNEVALYLRYREWQEASFVSIKAESQAAGRDIFVSVGRFFDYSENRLEPSPGLELKIKMALDEHFGKSGAPGGRWAWWKYDSRYRNWDAEEALLSISGPEGVAYYKAVLIQICHIVISSIHGSEI